MNIQELVKIAELRGEFFMSEWLVDIEIDNKRAAKLKPHQPASRGMNWSMIQLPRSNNQYIRCR